MSRRRTNYTYKLAGSVVSTTYPSGFTVKQEYDNIGRLQAVKNNATGASFVSGATYNAANQLTGFSYGNGISASYLYSADRLQLIELAHKRGETFLVDLSYDYNQGGNNNGQIAQIRDWVDTGRKATYTYDSLHRLKTAVTGSAQSPQWGVAPYLGSGRRVRIQFSQCRSLTLNLVDTSRRKGVKYKTEMVAYRLGFAGAAISAG